MIPKVGDIVKLNPLGSKHVYLGAIREVMGSNTAKVIAVYTHTSHHLLSITIQPCKGGPNCCIRILLPKGQFHQESSGTPSCFVLAEEIKEGSQTTPTVSHKNTCMLCGCAGDDLFFQFYCTNPKCKNYHP